jgi:UDPglucose 6-dehydrogenase
MKVAVFGLGFVGLTTALGFADKGFTVRGYDINEARSAEIREGSIPFLEPGLPEALSRTLGNGFAVTESAESAISDCDMAFFCVGTPGLADGSADLIYLFSAIDSIVEYVSPGCVLVVKSTVPPGTLTERVAPYIRSKGLLNPLAVNPEFLREGKCWDDFAKPDRIVCGVDKNDTTAFNASQMLFTELYAPFIAPIRFVAPTTAEFIKYMSNSLLATLISYSNEMALLAETIGSIDVAAAFHTLNEDRRLAGSGITTYIYPGCGYGGYCLPKDTVALSAAAKSRGFDTRILNEVIMLNDDMPQRTARKIERQTFDKTDAVGILGLSFKPNSDDVRNSSATKIISALLADGYTNIIAYDPVAAPGFEDVYKLPINYAQSTQEVCEACGTIAVVTAWDEFKGLRREFENIRWVDCRYCME